MNQNIDPKDVPQWIAASTTLADAAELQAWSIAMLNRIERGDLIIGILPVDEARQVPLALRKALDLGLAEAGIELADWLVRSPIDDADVPAAEQVLLEVIALGKHAAAVPLMRYRWFYRREDCAEEEAQQAFALLHQWCIQHQDDSDALYLLALVTCHGFGTDANPARSAQMLNKAASMGNADAMFELYIYHSQGIGVEVNEDKAIICLRRAAEAEHPRAMYNIGAFHATGRHVEQDMALAVAWYKRAAEAGHPKAAETLALMYEHGEGVEEDEEMAQKYWDMIT
ncbi:tetratricopeptide repeat protein [Undibacterium umbellatum]|uniref:Sel1 repeat family protein n=1 Tax=Undibacterium umbellatum TaxID=2762300 RepID=A0ABR6Z8K9_9BURK|nr:tetratricopeptide repeat protein [Undibacterium umbellatum]MBC3908097.1 sel1 repeat family protein [Undibacterium umbellatum]